MYNYESNIRKSYLVRLLYNMFFFSAVMVPFYTDWGHIPFHWIFFINAWFMFWNFLLEIPTGTVADFLGRKISIILGCIAGVIGSITYVSYPSIYVFLCSEIIFAVSFTLLSGADEALVYDSLIQAGKTDISKKVLSRMESFKLAGILISGPLGGLIARELGLQMPVLFQVIPLSLAGIVAFTLKEPPISEEKPRMTFRSYSRILMQGIRFFRNSSVLKTLTLDMVIVNGLAWSILWTYQALLRSAGVGIGYFGIIHATISLVEIIIISNFIRMEKWMNSRKRVLFLSAFIAGAFFIVLGLTQYIPLVILGILLAAGFGLTRRPLFSNYMNKYIPSETRATVLSTTSMISTFSIVVFNVIAALLTRWSIPVTMIIYGVAIVAFSFVSRIKEEQLID